MKDGSTQDTNFKMSLGDFNLNLSSTNLITEREPEPKDKECYENITTEKFTEFFHNDFEFNEKSTNVSHEKYQNNHQRLRETARFSNPKLENDVKCEFRQDISSKYRNSIKENIFIAEEDSVEDQSKISNNETYNKPKMDKKSIGNHKNRFINKNKEKEGKVRNRNNSVILGNEATYINSNANAGKLGFEIIPIEDFNLKLQKLGSTKHINTKIIKKEIEKKEENKKELEIKDEITKSSYTKSNLNKQSKYDSTKNDLYKVNTTEINESPDVLNRNKYSIRAVTESNLNHDHTSSINKTLAIINVHSPVKKERKKSIDFNKKNIFKKEDLADASIVNMTTKNKSDSDEDVELECCSEKVIDFQKSFYENPTLLKFFSDLRNLKYLEEFIESKHYLTKKKDDSKEDSLVNDELEKLKEEKLKLEESSVDMKKKLEKKHREIIEYKSKYDNIVFDNEILERKITELKSQLKLNQDSPDPCTTNSLKNQLKDKEENILFLQDEITSLNENIDNLKNEIGIMRKETNKNIKQNELQSKYNKLEEENSCLKNKLQSEISINKENKRGIETIKSNNNELKIQVDTINDKYQTIMEENYSMKKDLLNYDREIKVKSEAITKLSNDLEALKYRGERENDLKISMINYDSPNKNLINNNKKRINMDSLDESITYPHGNNFLNHKTINNIDSSDNSSQIKKNNSNSSNLLSSVGSNYDNSTSSSNKANNSNEFKSNSGNGRKGANPAKLDLLKNEAKIIEIEKKLIILQKSKEQIMSELGKMPDFPKQKVQILKKKSLEHSANEFVAEINQLKSELRALNTLQKDF